MQIKTIEVASPQEAGRVLVQFVTGVSQRSTKRPPTMPHAALLSAVNAMPGVGRGCALQVIGCFTCLKLLYDWLLYLPKADL